MKNKYNILIISDSHGKKDYIDVLVNNSFYDYIFYLGDGADRDLGINIYDTKFKIVKGNCDNYFSDIALGESVYLNGLKIFLTHGHEYGVKYGIENILAFAIKNNYKIVCFGHTHKQYYQQVNGIHLINSGALKNGDYAELKIIDNNIKVEFKNIFNNK